MSQRAARIKPGEVPLGSATLDCKLPFRVMVGVGQQRAFPPHEVGGVQQQQVELYSGYARPQRVGSCELGPRSPYRVGYGSILSPPASGARLYGDSSPSPTDALGSPDGFARTNLCGFPGVGSPGNARTPLSPPSVRLHGSPVGQPSCALTGRTSTPLSPTPTAKSPVPNMNMPRGNIPTGVEQPRAVFHHKAPPPLHPRPPPPSCVLQKRQVTSEKDPLGILDPIPSKPVSQPPSGASNPPSFHSQVSVMNVNIPPPAIVPLPSNLPLPTVKPGPMGHGSHVQRTQQTGPASSMSPSPVTSPVQGPGHSRMEASPHRSRSSSTSSDHGSFVMPAGHQAACGSLKVLPRSPRSAIGSPKPSLSSSPSTNKGEPLYQYKEPQLLPGVGQQHSNPVYSPTSASASSVTPSTSQKGPPGLLGMPLNQILNHQNAASFPASSLLSAAAKAQLANQNKHGTAGPSAGLGPAGGAGEGTECSNGHLGPRGLEGHSTLTPMLPPNSAMLLEGQSGRAALRDKLMAQQRDPLRVRRSGTAGNHNGSSSNMVYTMLNKRGLGGPHMGGPSATEQLRKAGRLGNLPPSTSMAQLLQSMSSHNHRPCPSPGPGSGPGPGAGPLLYNDSTAPQQNLLAQQRLRPPGDAMQHCQNLDSGGHLGPRPGQFPDMMAQMTSLSTCVAMGPGGGPVGPDGMPLGRPNTNPPPLSHPSPHPSQQNLHHGLTRTGMGMVPHGGTEGSCSQISAEAGET